MRLPRVLVWILAVAIVGGGGFALWQAYRTFPTSAAPGQDGWVSTATGPLGPGDRDLIVKIRLAGLWEHPVGQQMQERGVSDKVREVGGKISTEHLQLDALVITAARTLGVQLPNQPTEQQSGWMTEISNASGSTFDQVAVNRLRAAHGQVLPLIAQVRATTRNDTVRQLADDAAAFVGRHISYLESTGLVDYDALPEPPTPARAVVTRSGDYEQIPIALVALGSVLVLAAAGWIAVATIRRRREPHGTPRHRADNAPLAGAEQETIMTAAARHRAPRDDDE